MSATRHQLRQMSWIPGGTFSMGSDDFYPEERPVHQVAVDGFWIDDASGDRGRVPALREGHRVRDRRASAPPDPADYPDADPALLVPGSLVFRRTAGPVDLRDYRNWWAYVPGRGLAPSGRARAATLAAASGTR